MISFRLIARMITTLVVVMAAIYVGRGLWIYYMEDPWTRDAHVRADVVGIAPDVSGLVIDVVIKDNQPVRKGDLLFRVDPQRFLIAVAQARAALAGAQATLEQARRELERQERLGDIATAQQREQASLAARQAEASYQSANADLDLAQLNLARSDVRSTVNGTVANLQLSVGDYVSTGTARVALVDADSLRVEGYFEETKLQRIRLGDSVSIRLMGRQQLLNGHVENIAGGIEDRERTAGSGLLANINPTFNWVRLAQRVPVRIRLDAVPADVRLIAGLSATIEVESLAK